MPDLLSYVSAVFIPTLIFTLVWIAIGVTVFGLLHWVLKAQKQPFWRSDMKTDLAYWFLAPLPYGYVALVAAVLNLVRPSIVLMSIAIAAAGFGLVSAWHSPVFPCPRASWPWRC